MIINNTLIPVLFVLKHIIIVNAIHAQEETLSWLTDAFAPTLSSTSFTEVICCHFTLAFCQCTLSLHTPMFSTGRCQLHF